MKTLTKTLTAAAVVGAMALPATGALAASKTEKAVIGALLGGVLGAAVSNGDSTATLAGVAAGAAIGASTAKDKNRYGYDNRYDSRGRYVQPTRYDNRYNGYNSRSNYGYDQRGYDTRYVSQYGYR